MNYAKKVYEYAKNKNKTSLQLRSATLNQILSICGLETVPEDLFYQKVRKRVSNKLRREEASIVAENTRNRALSAIREITGMENATVEYAKAGSIVNESCWIIKKGE